jgi:hypothetical protein
MEPMEGEIIESAESSEEASPTQEHVDLLDFSVVPVASSVTQSPPVADLLDFTETHGVISNGASKADQEGGDVLSSRDLPGASQTRKADGRQLQSELATTEESLDASHLVEASSCIGGAMIDTSAHPPQATSDATAQKPSGAQIRNTLGESTTPMEVEAPTNGEVRSTGSDETTREPSAGSPATLPSDRPSDADTGTPRSSSLEPTSTASSNEDPSKKILALEAELVKAQVLLETLQAQQNESTTTNEPQSRSRKQGPLSRE